MYQVDTEMNIGQAIQLFLRRSKLKGNMQAMRLTYIWENLMGKTIAKYTEKIEIIGNKLIIHTQVAPLKQELNFQKPQLIQRVNEALQENVVKEVVIR